ncbi:type VII secretion protein EccB [Amycolatopsis palatopharyngis]|uniref:type VII secretion protein EccB n=1 Tax=Amycolatopsis palatopharyngis TaxID=187982 RepID=UPI000E271A72|nr:type VII secretion protein EccB [Amycolatopsis palatopharyngis]
MPSTPTTKSQVHAYQFVLRRMQSALVRRDAVMLHDPMRTHSRATIVGAVLSALAMLGFIIFGLFKPSPQAPGPGNIVIAEQSGAIYVMAGSPKKLIPTFNLASARLLLMAQTDQEGGEGGPPAGGAAAGPVEAVEPTVIPDEQLKDIPRGRLHGIPNGPESLPTGEMRVSPEWAVCDEIGLDPSLPDPTSINVNETTVFAGVSDLGNELATNEAILATSENDETYLIYRLVDNPNQPNANTVRAKVDLSKGSVRAALGLSAKPRQISMGLLNAIPEVNALNPPTVAGAGTSNSLGLSGLFVGDVFSVSRTGEADEFWVVTKSGIQEVSKAVADMIRYEKSISADEIDSVRPDAISNVPVLRPGDPDYLQVSEYPQAVPTVLEAEKHPVTCLGWNVAGEGVNRGGQTKVYVGAELPGPKNEAGDSTAVQIGQPSPDGLQIDKFYLQPGMAAVVRSVTAKETFDKGAIQLITDRGMRYGVPDLRTAQGLGLDPQQPAPDNIIRLLPTGASLNTQDVLRTFDSVPVEENAGTFTEPKPQAAGN